ncbi:MAG TPA: ABC transporter ATP-binding protein [Planctomycetota bacterium]|nr:ABC transporter ATP-binding protein [Planctomycetota bacterium]
MLEVEGLVVAYGAVEALHGIDLSAAEGEIVALIGANGAGKTTTLKAISGLLPARAGRVLLDGRPITGLAPHKIVGLGVSHAPEGRRIFTDLTVRENLSLGAYVARSRRAEAERLERVLELFPRLRERIEQAGGTLSGGEQQMLAIGRALMAAPRMLLLDEPSLGLAPLLVQEIFREIARINREDGATILLVEQNAHMALSLAHRGYVLETGRVVLADDAKRLLADPQVRGAYLGTA